MLHRPSRLVRLADLATRVERARGMTDHLMGDVIETACYRFAAPDNLHEANRVRRFMRTGAWIDAALALIELELPQWSLRCVARENGQWRCVLVRGSLVADWLDDTIRSEDEALPLALLAAFVEAVRLATEAGEAIPQARLKPHLAEADVKKGPGCDNFG